MRPSPALFWKCAPFSVCLVAFSGGATSIAQELESGPEASKSQHVELIGIGSVPGNALDRSGISATLEEGTPANQLGGFSAIDYSAKERAYWVLPDRGPADGAASFPCRLHLIALELSQASQELQPSIQRTVLLKNEAGEAFTGALHALPSTPFQRGMALDPEGLRQSQRGDFYVSDEYGPGIDVFSQQGIRLDSFVIEESMGLTREIDLQQAQSGAMPNRGLEGLALSVDGAFFIAAMQGPLIQDSKYRDGKRYSNFTRLLQSPCNGRGKTRQWVYPLTDQVNGISEILAVDEHRYLVLERDGEARPNAKSKSIYMIDLQAATDVSDQSRLPAKKLPQGCNAVSKELWIDLLDPQWKIPSEHNLEKPEGLTWGPPLVDGRRLLIVCFDNDFQRDVDSLFLAFAISDRLERP